MRRCGPIAAFALAVLCSSPALAQEAAAPPAPAEEPAWGQSPDTPVPVTDSGGASPTPRELKRRAREIARLERIMAIEGPEFDHDRYKRYRAQKAAGAALTGLGAASVVASVLFGFVLVAVDMNDYKSDDGVGTPPERAAFWTMLTAGITAVAVGAPLLAIGKRGKERQLFLERKDEILAPIDPAATVSLFADPQGGGGLRLETRF